MSLDELYRKEVLRLAAEAHGAERLALPEKTVVRVNPICGDRITLDLRFERGRIAALGYEVKACVLCQASASILGATASGLNQAQTLALRSRVAQMLASGDAPPEAPHGAFALLAPVKDHKSRHNCVLLPLDALLEAFGA